MAHSFPAVRCGYGTADNVIGNGSFDWLSLRLIINTLGERENEITTLSVAAL